MAIQKKHPIPKSSILLGHKQVLKCRVLAFNEKALAIWAAQFIRVILTYFMLCLCTLVSTHQRSTFNPTPLPGKGQSVSLFSFY